MAALLLQTLTQCEKVYAYQQNAFDAKSIADLNKSLGLSLPLESSPVKTKTRLEVTDAEKCSGLLASVKSFVIYAQVSLL